MSNDTQNTYNQDIGENTFDVFLHTRVDAGNQDLEGINIEENTWGEEQNTWDHKSGVVLSRNMHQLWEDDQAYDQHLIQSLVEVARRPPPPRVIDVIFLLTSSPESEEGVVAPYSGHSGKCLRTMQKHQQNIQGDCTESDNDEDQMGPTSDDGKDGEQGQRATTGGKCMRYVLENSGDGEKVDSDNEDDNTHDSYSQVFNERDARAMVMNNTNADNENADIPINSTMVVDMDHIEAMEVERALVMPAERAAHDDASELTTSNSAFQVREPPAQALNGASGANRPHVIVIDDD